MAEERTLGSPSIEEALARGVRVRRTGRTEKRKSRMVSRNQGGRELAT